MERGQILTELLKQPQYAPLPVEKEVIVLFAATQGFMDAVSIDRVGAYETALFIFMDASYPKIAESIRADRDISDETDTALRAALDEFNQSGTF